MGSINWKLRFKNKKSLTAIIALGVSIVYTVLKMCGVVPTVGQEEILGLGELVIAFLVATGIVVDPTTEGFGDSEDAMGRSEPK